MARVHSASGHDKVGPGSDAIFENCSFVFRKDRAWRNCDGGADVRRLGCGRIGPGAVRIHDVVPHHVPAFSIGLASYLAVLEALWLWTGREVYINLFNYWLKIFAVAFGMGVVSGIVMSYQFGTNWSAFLRQDRSGDRAADGL